jgi:hypothetical protein
MTYSIENLIFALKSDMELSASIRSDIAGVLERYQETLNEAAAAEAKKRKAPNKSGILKCDPETLKVIAKYDTRKEANIANEKPENSSGIGDAANGRSSTHFAYGYKWFFVDEYELLTGLQLPKEL